MRNEMLRIVVVFGMVVQTASANAQSVEAIENATIQPAGPRQGGSGEAFFNIEGADNGNFASYAVARFDVSDIKQQFDADFGAGDWSLGTVELLLTQANASFTVDGPVEVYFTADDASELFTSIVLQYPFDDDFPDAKSILTYDFVEVENGEVEVHTLFDTSTEGSEGGLALRDDILANDLVTLALVEASPTVAATYAGYTHDTYEGPTLRLTATGAVGAALQAGDADQDLDFDQFDLIRVQVASKYLTGESATWGEGDWDAAPGGRPGNPPAGDGVFNQLDIVAAQVAGVYLTGPYAALRPGGDRADGQTSVGYDANTGEVFVDAPQNANLTSINIDSATGIFTGQAAQNLGGSFDNDADDNIFKATFGSSFGAISFGSVAQPGLSPEFVLGDLTVVGSLEGGGALGDVDLIYIPVPEPSSGSLLALALMGLMGRVVFVRG